MSDFRQDYHPGASPAATARTAAAATGFATTLYDRLNTADANSQYLWGTQQLKKSMTDFNNSLLTNNDYSGYVDKMKSADQSSFDSVMSKITNPSAKEKLNQEWQTMSTDHYDQVSTLATKQKVAAIDGRYVDSWNSVVDSSSSAAEKKQELKGIYDSWLSAGTRDKVALARQLGTAYAQIDSQDAYAQGMAALQKSGNLEDGLKAIDDYQGIPDSVKGTLGSKLTTQWKFIEQQRVRQVDQKNLGTLDQYVQALTKGQLSPDDIANAPFVAGGSNGLAPADLRLRLDSALRASGRSPNNIPAKSDPSDVAKAYDIAHDQNITQGDKVSQIIGLGGLTKADMNKYSNMAGQPTTAAFQEVDRQLQGIKGWTSQELSDAKGMVADLQNVAVEKNMSPAQVLSEFAKIRDVVNDKVLENAVATSFTWRPAAGLLGTKPDKKALSDFLTQEQTNLSDKNLEHTRYVANIEEKAIPQVQQLAKDENIDVAQFGFDGKGNLMLQSPDGTVYKVVPSDKQPYVSFEAAK